VLDGRIWGQMPVDPLCRLDDGDGQPHLGDQMHTALTDAQSEP
jgi:hypothetical protein